MVVYCVILLLVLVVVGIVMIGSVGCIGVLFVVFVVLDRMCSMWLKLLCLVVSIFVELIIELLLSVISMFGLVDSVVSCLYVCCSIGIDGFVLM